MNVKSEKKAKSDQVKSYIKRLNKVIPESGDIELALLKIHLLIEEVLTDIICKEFKNPKNIKEARLSFSQKIKIAKAIGGLPDSDWIWKALHLLNQARNELAHNLTSDEISEKLNIFDNYVNTKHKIEYQKIQSLKQTSLHFAYVLTFSILSAHADFRAKSLEAK